MGRFKRRREIGRGGYGIVYEALDTQHNEIVALKVLDSNAGVPKKEVALNHRITHPNVLKINDCTPDDGSWCVSMEYADGPSLHESIKESGPLPFEKCLELVLPLLEGARAAHKAGVVHCDIKPSNIRQKGKVWKLADWGQARELGTPIDPAQKVGTPPYAIPEQTAVGRIWDERADVHAFGVLLCAMLSGQLFGPDEAVPIPSGLPPFLENAIQHCIDLNPDRRFATVDELVAALKPAPALDPAPAEPIVDPPVRGRRGYRAVVAGLTLLALALVIVAMNNVVREAPKSSRPLLASAEPAKPSDGAASDPMVLPKRSTRRVAILDFKNKTGDPSLDSDATRIPDTLDSDLSNLRGVMLVDATGVASADVVISGTLDKQDNKFVLTAQVNEVDTEHPTAVQSVRKPQQDFFELEADLAKQLAAAIQPRLSDRERQDLEEAAAQPHNSETSGNFAAGLRYLHENMPDRALKSFAAVIAAEPRFPGVQYYRAQALEKLNRTDQAIEALKTALPEAEADHPLLWQWDFQRPGSHGLISAFDSAHQQLQHSLFHNEVFGAFRREAIYAEARKNGTALYFMDPARHAAPELVLDDKDILFGTNNDRAYSDGNMTILTSRSEGSDGTTSERLYAFSSDHSIRWTWDMPREATNDLPLAGLVGNSFVVAMPRLHRIDVVDVRSGKLRWSKDNMPMQSAEFPLTAHTVKHQDIVMFRFNDTYRAVRLSDGKDAWTVPGITSPQLSQLVTDKLLVIFEPERRILTVNLETGKLVHDIPIPQFVDNAHIRLFVSVPVVGAFIKDDVLYVLSKDLQLCAINLVSTSRSGPILWKTALGSRFWSIAAADKKVYVTTDNGELVVLDATDGRMVSEASIPVRSAIRHIEDNLVVLNTDTNAKLFAIHNDGTVAWGELSCLPWEITSVNGAVVTYSSESQLFAVEAATGNILWKHPGDPMMYVQTIGNRVFILGPDGVSEYSTGKRTESVSDRKVFTALARLFLKKRNLEQATAYAQRAAELDPDYPDLAWVRAQIYAEQHKVELAGVELARYANLVGVDSKEGIDALAEMSRNYRLQWQSPIDMNVAGEPVVVEDRIVSVGRRALDTLHLLALDATTGEMRWRFEAERFVASVVGTYENKPVLWYVTGDAKDYAAIQLYRIDIRNGHRELIAIWRKPARIEQAWIAASANRVFVATASPKPEARFVDVGIDAIDAANGQVVWPKTLRIANATVQELNGPVTVFAAQQDTLTYAVGAEHGTLLASNGAPTTAVVVTQSQPLHKVVNETVAEYIDRKSGKVLAKHSVLWRPFTFGIEGGMLYAFTPDGRAYAMKPYIVQPVKSRINRGGVH